MEASLYIGDLPLILEDWQETEGPKGSLDSLRGTILCPASNWRAALEDLGYVRDKELPASLGHHSMWVNDLVPGARTGSTIEVAINCLGLLLPDEKRKITLSGTQQRYSIGPEEKKPGPLRDSGGEYVLQDLNGWFVQDDGSHVPRELYPSIIIGDQTAGPTPAISAGIAVLTCTTSYFATTRPDVQDVNTVQLPPVLDLDTPTLTPLQAAYVNLRTNVPHGWVLTARQVEVLFETGLRTGSEGVGGLLGLYAATDTFSYIIPKEPI